MLESLRSASDSDIISGAKPAGVQEHRGMLSLLTHLVEFERRSLHLKLGFQSLFHYCTAELGYSESSAMRRITGARCVARFPEVFALLQSGKLTLSAVSRIAKVLTPENAVDLVERVGGKSLREIESIVAEFEPQTTLPRDHVRTVVLRVPARVAAELEQGPGADRPEHNRNGGKKASSDASDGGCVCVSDNETAPTIRAIDDTSMLERRIVVQFAARGEFMAKLERVRALVWHSLPNATFEQLFELALDELIARRDPCERQKRREKRATVSMTACASATTPAPAGKRYVPAAVRDHVFARDGFRCAFVAPDGRRCTSTVALQVDHVRPVARGGASTTENLRILCAQHNRLEAGRILGRYGPPEKAPQ